MCKYQVVVKSVNGGARAIRATFTSADAADERGREALMFSSADQAFVFCDGELSHRIGWKDREPMTAPITYVKDELER